jgi:hypothetical protein
VTSNGKKKKKKKKKKHGKWKERRGNFETYTEKSLKEDSDEIHHAPKCVGNNRQAPPTALTLHNAAIRIHVRHAERKPIINQSYKTNSNISTNIFDFQKNSHFVAVMFRRVAVVVVARPPAMRLNTARFVNTAAVVPNAHNRHHDNNNNKNNNSKSKFRIAASTLVAASIFGVVKCAQVNNDDEFVESSSGFSFPRRSEGKELVSASMRTLSYVFQTYVVAFYIDAVPRVSGVSLDSFEAFERDSAARVIADVLDNATSNLKLELRPSRDTIGNHLVSAWRPKLQQRLSGSEPLAPTDAALLDSLGEILNKRRFPYRSSLVIDWDKRKHALTISHDGAPVATLVNADRVARALFAMYVDEKPTAANIKHDFSRGIFDLLKNKKQ